MRVKKKVEVPKNSGRRSTDDPPLADFRASPTESVGSEI